MKVVEMKDATESLSAYAKKVKNEPVVVTMKGKPVAMLQPVGPHTDMENLAVTSSPKFQAIIAESRASLAAEGGISTEEMRRRVAARRLKRKAG